MLEEYVDLTGRKSEDVLRNAWMKKLLLDRMSDLIGQGHACLH